MVLDLLEQVTKNDLTISKSTTYMGNTLTVFMFQDLDTLNIFRFYQVSTIILDNVL